MANRGHDRSLKLVGGSPSNSIATKNSGKSMPSMGKAKQPKRSPAGNSHGPKSSKM